MPLGAALSIQSMAVVGVRCCSSSQSPPVSGHISRRPPNSTRQAHFYRRWPSLPCKLERHMTSFGVAFSKASTIPQLFPAFKYLDLQSKSFRISRPGGSFGIDKATSDNDVILTDNDHQSTIVLRFPAVALLVTNAFMLGMPFEASAETCEVDNSIFNMPLLLSVALIGATVGGLLARQRRGELQRLNEQLRQINAALRRQAKIESYAPGLSYAPVGGRAQEKEVIVDPRKEELISHLKGGKNFLRNQDPEKAFEEFQTALKLAQELRDSLEEKKAARGLGASLQRQGKFREAIKYHSMVLAASVREGEESGNTEAYGAIADCYTEIGDLEQAANFYDKYIARLQTD